MGTPGPRIMRIHLVQYSTSARSGKNPQARIEKEGLTERVIILCKLNKSLLESYTLIPWFLRISVLRVSLVRFFKKCYFYYIS